MTDDTTDNNNNVKQFSLNLVSPEEKDAELKDCLTRGLEDLTREITAKNVVSFFAIILNDSDSLVFIGAGEAQPLKTLGALRQAEYELLKSL